MECLTKRLDQLGSLKDEVWNICLLKKICQKKASDAATRNQNFGLTLDVEPLYRRHRQNMSLSSHFMYMRARKGGG